MKEQSAWLLDCESSKNWQAPLGPMVGHAVGLEVNIMDEEYENHFNLT